MPQSIEKLNSFMNKFFLDNKHPELSAVWNKKSFQSKVNELMILQPVEKVKRNKNAYMFYQTDQRASNKEKFEGMSSHEINKEIGKMWTELKDTSPDSVKKFTDLAEEDKNRYKKETGKVDKPKRKVIANSYIRYTKEYRQKVREECPELSNKEITKELSVRWNKLKSENSDVFKKFDKEYRDAKSADVSKKEGSKQKKKSVPKPKVIDSDDSDVTLVETDED